MVKTGCPIDDQVISTYEELRKGHIKGAVFGIIDNTIKLVEGSIIDKNAGPEGFESVSIVIFIFFTKIRPLLPILFTCLFFNLAYEIFCQRAGLLYCIYL